MSVLSHQSIRRVFNNPYGNPEAKAEVRPWSERGVFEGMSFGLSACGYDLRIASSLTLPAGGFVLATTVEFVRLPDDVMAVVRDKSTWARRGLQLFNTQFEPGWYGYPTLELRNQGGDALVIREGMPICQMVFHWLDEVTEAPYKGKYQDQQQVPTPAKDEAPPGGWRDGADRSSRRGSRV